VPEHKSYLEPFVGGASFFLNKQPSLLETISDADGRLINLFRILRERPGELIPLLELTLYSRSEFQLACEVSEDPLEDARRFFVRALQSFGGITHSTRRANSFRTDVKESRNGIAASNSKWHSKIEGLWDVVDRFRMAQIDNRSAFYMIPKFNQPDTFMYLDPPYDHATRTSSNDYKHEFTMDDHYHLATLANESHAKIMLSHNESAFYDSLYPAPHWKRIDAKERRSNLGKGLIQKEVIYLNYFNELIA
jgi:DNA adenine methylase